ncbi:ABC transporter permease [uncultured Serinicoccus sp.]|uniref:ABC transporter permease n=1 Tax=uncultured Serinicoccus sp. TaxID=735514 RepID=UPI002620F230|nr:FtsX-like permease family protein [uncultured Serinicoccus sp.]
MAARWMAAGLASRGRRLASAAVAILIGVGFLTTSLVVVSTAQAGLEDAVAGGLRDADLVVTGADDTWLATDDVDRVAGTPGVDRVVADATVGVDHGSSFLAATSVPAGGMTLLEGRMPTGADEATVNQALAGQVAVGDELTLATRTVDGAVGDPLTLTVVGVVDPGEVHTLSYTEGFLTTDATLRELDPGVSYESAQVTVAGTATVDEVREALAEAVPGAALRTGPEAAADRVAGLTGQTFVLGSVLLGFGAVSLATAAIVIANTFTITLAQRTGELALLRCVGATRGQVRRSVLLEALVLGTAASVVGVGAGLGVAQLLLGLARGADLGIPLGTGLEVGWLSLVVPVLVGLAITLLASWWPAGRATRVSPLAALRPAGEPAATSRVSRVRVLLALLLVAGGTGLMVLAALLRQVLLGVAGGLVSFVGVLLAAVVLVPALVRLLGLAARPAGVPGRLAVSGAVRNPGRAAATSAALLVGVTLITMTSVGAASGERTALGEIDQAFAVDLVAQTEPGLEGDVPVPTAVEPGLVDRLSAVDGVAAAEVVQTAYLDVGAMEGVPAAALAPATAQQVLRSEELVAALAPGTVGLGSYDRVAYGVEAGDTLTVGGPGGSRDLTVVELGLGAAGLALQPEDLQSLSGGGANLQPGAVLLRLDDDADVGDTMTAVGEVAEDGGMTVQGAAAERALVAQVLDVMVLVATALLGVAVLIAVVGIANTLSLSVIERHREHALLRGLGLTRGQMRAMLLTEGVLLALVSAGLGLALGIGYAALGVQTILPAGTPLALAVPWARVGVIVGVALLAGVLASVLPARRAARVSPAEGLAAA